MSCQENVFGVAALSDCFDDDALAAFAAGLIVDHFGTLRYAHGASTHKEILESLEWPRMPALVACAAGGAIDFDAFASGIRRQARLAREKGLVRPDGLPRRRRQKGTEETHLCKVAA